MSVESFFIIFITMLVFSSLTFISSGHIRICISFTLLIIFALYLSTYVNKTKFKLPKYHINDKVQLPDKTWGNIDSIAYKIEGAWYNQKLLKD